VTHWETVWTFNTARFVVTLDIAPEDMPPEDGLCFDDDVAFAREGGWHWFQARVQVAFHDVRNPAKWAVTRDRVLGEDYLGGCSYHDLEGFKSGGYFRDMVRSAITEARGTVRRISSSLANVKG
jgi:hypothetical protein